MYTYCFNCSFGRGHRRSVGILCTRTVLTVVLEEATDAVLVFCVQYCFNCSFGRGHRRSVGILCTRTVLTVVLEEATDAVLVFCVHVLF